MNDLYYELFYFCAKFYGHTNKNIPIIFIVSVGVMAILILSIIKKLSKNNPTIDMFQEILAVAIIMIGVAIIFLSIIQEAPNDIKVTTNVGQYREITAQKYRLDNHIL